jgi:septal ring factor EnvC (AmiA/AmiB activator)
MAEPTYEQGLKEGRVDALLEEHTARLNKINGSVERHAKSVENLAKSVREGFDKVATEMRDAAEAARARDLAVEVAAETLAKETERRRVEAESVRVERAEALNVPVRTWNLRANKATVLGIAITVVSTVAALYFAFH